MSGAALDDTTAALVALSRWLGAPERDYAILGEGNASAAVGDGTFLVKASGAELGTLDEDGLVRLDRKRVLAVVDAPPEGDAAVRAALEGAIVGSDGRRRPSVEGPLHAVCLDAPGVSVVGHTHPTAVNAIACSGLFEATLAGRVFPDEIVLCGAESLLVPYVDPGIPLARAVRDRLLDFIARTGAAPKTIYLQNHGLVVLGATCAEVRSTTAMAVKAARVRLGAAALGGIHPLDDANVQRIDSRPDEHFRRAAIAAAEAARKERAQ